MNIFKKLIAVLKDKPHLYDIVFEGNTPAGKKFDIIYLDPPYKIAFDEAVKIADLVNEYDLLENDGVMIVEHASDEPFNIDVINMKFERSCSYGLCVVTFFSKS